MNAPDPGQRMITVGRLHGAFGVRGELKLESFTAPGNAILRYQPWTLRDAQGRERVVEGARGRAGAKGLVATIPGIEGREAAETMRGTEVLVPRSALPPPAPGEYYWVDLEGLRVRNVDGVDFGFVSHLFSTGANKYANRFTLGHFDLPMRNCTVLLDGKTVVDKGRLVPQLAP